MWNKRFLQIAALSVSGVSAACAAPSGVMPLITPSFEAQPAAKPSAAALRPVGPNLGEQSGGPVLIAPPSGKVSPSVATPEKPVQAAIPRAASAVPLQQSEPVDPNSPASQLSALQAQIAILKAKAEVAKLQQSIAETAQKSGPSLTGSPLRMTPRAGAVEAPYRLLGVSGFDGALTARLSSASQGVQTVMMGQTLSGGWQVVSITPMRVVLRHQRAERILEVR